MYKKREQLVNTIHMISTPTTTRVDDLIGELSVIPAASFLVDFYEERGDMPELIMIFEETHINPRGRSLS